MSLFPLSVVMRGKASSVQFIPKTGTTAEALLCWLDCLSDRRLSAASETSEAYSATASSRGHFSKSIRLI